MQQTSTLLLTLSFFYSLTCTAQNNTTILKGTVISAGSGKAVSYATISWSGSGISTISNEEGRFVLKIPIPRKPDSLHISHVGYQPVSILLNYTDTSARTITLAEKSSQLAAVTIKTINPLHLLKRAIEKIPENYPVNAYTCQGFYRMTGKKEKRIIDLSEAVVQVHNENYARRNKQLKVIKARWDQDQTVFGNADGIDIGAKPEDIMDEDIVSNAGASGLLSKEGLKDHVFTYNGLVDYNGQEAYSIGFDQKEDVKKALDKGTIYIDTHSLAFLQFVKYKSPKGIQYWEFKFTQRLLLKVLGVQIRLLGDSGYVTYKKYGSKYYLDHIYGTARWRIMGGRRRFELNPMQLRFNYLTTSIDTTAVTAFTRKEVQRNSSLIETQAPDKNTDSTDAFWGDYNLILADFKVDSAIKVIRANNETLNYKQTLARQLSKYKAGAREKIDSILSFYFHKEQFNGVALVKYQGSLIYEKGFGLCNQQKKLPNTPQTQFRIGSTSKQFTAMLIMQLANENKLNIDDSAGRFIPGYQNGKVTIRQLLTHQSGIPNYLDDENNLVKIFTQKYTALEMVKQFCSDSLEFEPGTQMNYSNSGFVALAAIIEQVTGKPYGHVLAEKIFIPLGMQHSYFGKEGQDTSHLAVGYVNGEPEQLYPVQNVIGAGGITSTAEDLLLWHNALSANTLLPKEKQDELFKPRVLWDEWGAYYGYGWMIDRLQFGASKKHIIQYHPGTELGFFDMLVRQPDKDIFIILLSNKGDFPRFDMTDLLLAELN